MKYAFMRAHQGEFLVEVMSTVLGASSSGFYGWLVRDHAAKAAKKNALIETISKVHVASRGIYGSPRVFKALQSMGSIISKATVERVMREKIVGNSSPFHDLSRRRSWQHSRATNL